MPSSYTTSLRLTLPATGENSGTWGTLVNTGITELTDAAIAGYVSIAMTDADYTLTVANGLTDQARRMMLNMTGTLTAARNVICPTASKLYIIKNATTGGFAITLKTSAGTGISIPNGSSMLLMCNGTDVVDAVTNFSSLTLGSPLLPASGGTGITSLGTGVATWLGTPSSANLAAAVTDETGSGALVFGTSPTLASPTITGTGTAAFGNLSYTGTLTGGTGVVNLGSGQFYKDASGNVGIGTSSPTSPLAVKTDTDFVVATRTASTGTGARIVGLNAAQNAYKDLVLDGATLKLATGGITQATLDASGNLGIGTSSPGAKLDIGGTNNTVFFKNSGATTGYALATISNTSGAFQYGIASSTGTFWGTGNAGNYSANIGTTSATNLGFGTSDTLRMLLDSSGNLGLGVTPSAWQTTSYRVLELPGGVSLFGQTDAQSMELASNAYLNASYSWTYKASDYASHYRQYQGQHQWFTAPSGTAGNAITFTQAMTLSNASDITRLKLATVTSGSGANDGFELIHGGTDAYVWNYENGSLLFATNNTERARITSGGDLLVGDTANTSGARFYVKGSGATSGSVAMVVRNSTPADLLYIRNDGYTGFGLNATAMTLDASGNLGLGVTPSAWVSNRRVLQIGGGAAALALNGTGAVSEIFANAYRNTGGTYIYAATGHASYVDFNNSSTGGWSWSTAPSGTAGNAISFTQAMTLDASGLLTVGRTPAASAIIDAQSDAYGIIRVRGGTATNQGSAFYGTSGSDITRFAFGQVSRISGGTPGDDAIAYSAGYLAFAAGGTEKARIDSSGNLLVGTTTNTENYKENLQFSGATVNGLYIKNTASTGGPIFIAAIDSAQSLNNTTQAITYTDSTAERFSVRKNGGIANYSANNVALSDERLKTNIQPATSYLDKICAIPVKTFLYKDQTDTERNLGVIAQDVDAVAPELIDHSGFGETPEGESPYLAVYQTDLQYALMKCIQEQQALITDLRARVAALEAN